MNGMKAYVGVTGAIFLLLLFAHAARLVQEGSGPLKDPWFVFATLLSAVFSAWAWRVLRKTKRGV